MRAATAAGTRVDPPAHNFRPSELTWFWTVRYVDINLPVFQERQWRSTNFTPQNLALHMAHCHLDSRSQRRRLCRQAAAMSGPTVKHNFRFSKCGFGWSAAFQTCWRTSQPELRLNCQDLKKQRQQQQPLCGGGGLLEPAATAPVKTTDTPKRNFRSSTWCWVLYSRSDPRPKYQDITNSSGHV